MTVYEPLPFGGKKVMDTVDFGSIHAADGCHMWQRGREGEEWGGYVLPPEVFDELRGATTILPAELSSTGRVGERLIFSDRKKAVEALVRAQGK